MWHYQVNDKQYGPVDFKQFAELIENGVITKDTPVLTEIMSDWRKAGDIPALKERYFSNNRKKEKVTAQKAWIQDRIALVLTATAIVFALPVIIAIIASILSH